MTHVRNGRSVASGDSVMIGPLSATLGDYRADSAATITAASWSQPPTNGDGTTREVTYTAGETRHYNFAPDESLVRVSENIGHEDLVLTTVKHLNSTNAALQLD